MYCVLKQLENSKSHSILIDLFFASQRAISSGEAHSPILLNIPSVCRMRPRSEAEVIYLNTPIMHWFFSENVSHQYNSGYWLPGDWPQLETEAKREGDNEGQCRQPGCQNLSIQKSKSYTDRACAYALVIRSSTARCKEYCGLKHTLKTVGDVSQCVWHRCVCFRPTLSQ